HGTHQPKEERNPLHDWRVRLDRDDDFFPPFLTSVSGVLNHLVKQGYADGSRVAAAGISRGGYAALRFAAQEPRVRAVAAFAPVTDLLALREFDGASNSALVQSVSLVRFAGQLTATRILIMIGSTDYRVGTRNSISLFERLVESAVAQGKAPAAELRV